MTENALLALEDGSLFRGLSIGCDGITDGEVVFNTSITGYQEILTDPSYCKQIVTLTQPHIGNVGTNGEDEESDQVYVSGLVIRNLPLLASNWRSEDSLSEYLKRNNVVAIADIDTRRLTRILRDKGAMKACLCAGEQLDANAAIDKARQFAGLEGADLAKVVSTKSEYDWQDGAWQLGEGFAKPSTAPEFKVIAYDFGVKRNILRLLTSAGCDVSVVPAETPAAEVLKRKPDGVFLSNGPGDPFACEYAINAIREIVASGIPVFGICLGHQLLALAMGAKTVKMKFGHHGANHPVQDLASKQVLITSQNHGFAVDEATLPANLKATHRSLFDGSLQGVHHTEKPAFSFQGHPEASPGPHDVQPLFQHFVELMQQHRND